MQVYAYDYRKVAVELQEGRDRGLSLFVEMFAALCDRTRQRILLLLDERERSVNELVQQFNLSQPTISRHLQVLRRAGLVKARREGQQVVYSIDGESMGGCLADFCSSFACCAPFFGRKASQGEAKADGEATPQSPIPDLC